MNFGCRNEIKLHEMFVFMGTLIKFYVSDSKGREKERQRIPEGKNNEKKEERMKIRIKRKNVCSDHIVNSMENDWNENHLKNRIRYLQKYL